MSANGQLLDSELAPIPGGFRLRVDAAAAFNAMSAEQTVVVRDAYRVLGHPGDYRAGRWSQWAAWERYQAGGSLAAYPGTSNHGWGTAIDVLTPAYRTVIDRIGAKYGWSKAWSDAPCVPLGTRILTRRGFVAYDEVRPGDETVGYNDDGRSAWTPILGVQVFDDAVVRRYETSRFALDCTSGHRWLYEDRLTGRRLVGTLDAMPKQAKLLLAVPLGAEGEGLPITDDEAALIGWALTDGSIYRFENSRGRRAFARIYQTKQVGVAAITELMRLFEHRYDNAYVTSGGPSHMWYIGRSTFSPILHRSRLDELGPVAFVLALSHSQRRAFLEAIRMAEGTQPTTKEIAQQDSRANGPMREAIAIAGVLEGNAIVMRPRTVTLANATPYRNYFECVGERKEVVWCPTTGLGTWTAEQDGHVFLTHNSEWWHILYQPGHYHPPPPDPYSYGRYPTGPFPFGKLALNERAVVQEFDQLTHRQTVRREQLLTEIRFLRDRVWTVAMRDHPPSWGTDYRGWRWQRLNDRLHGRDVRGK